MHGFAEIEECILFPDVNVQRGARLKKVIVEKGVLIPENFEAGYDLEEDAKRFTITEEGLVVIPKDAIL